MSAQHRTETRDEREARPCHWWGPQGFTNTFHEFDLRPGGAWRFTMHGPDGGNYPNESVFVEVANEQNLDRLETHLEHGVFGDVQ